MVEEETSCTYSVRSATCLFSENEGTFVTDLQADSRSVQPVLLFNDFQWKSSVHVFCNNIQGYIIH